VPALGCGVEPEPRDDLPLVCADLQVCAIDEDCVVTNADPCCGLAQIAVLADRVDEVAERVGDCPDPYPICIDCAVMDGVAHCVEGRCEVGGLAIDPQ
jgi:hypothetical protein